MATVDEKYQLTLSGPQIDDALLQMNIRAPEGWTRGTRDGVAVGSASEYYHNNAMWYAQNAADSAARAEGAIPSGTAGAVFFDRAQTLTATQQAQARANIMAGGSNPNLLDNPWFTVNQRGITSASGTGAFTYKKYRMDRWFTTYSSNPDTGSWDLTDGVLTIDNSGTTNRGLFCQRVENHAWLAGKKITASVLFADGTIKSGTITRTDSYGQGFGVAGISLEFSPENDILFGPTRGGTIAIKAVKLELGPYSTLANDVPPDYDTELTNCRRYFQRFKFVINHPMASGYANSATSLRFALPAPVAMRSVSNITASYTGTIRCIGNGTRLTPTAMQASTISPNIVALNVTVSGATQDQTYALAETTGSGYIDVSVDL